MALDGGMGLASELLPFIPMSILWIIGLAVMGLVGVILYTQKHLNWPIIVCLACGLLALVYLQIFGSHQSNLLLRNITGFLFGIGTIWIAYPLLQEGFDDIRRETQTKLAGSEIQ